MKINFFGLFSGRDRKANSMSAEGTPSLSFDELNPLLAKQLSELEVQIGQLAQVQFELSEERTKMRIDMEALKRVLQDSQPQAPATKPLNNEAI